MLALEGGYVGDEVGDAVVHCLRALLGEIQPDQQLLEQLKKVPAQQAVADIHTTIQNHVSLLQIYICNIQNYAFVNIDTIAQFP